MGITHLETLVLQVMDVAVIATPASIRMAIRATHVGADAVDEWHVCDALRTLEAGGYVRRLFVRDAETGNCVPYAWMLTVAGELARARGQL